MIQYAFSIIAVNTMYNANFNIIDDDSADEMFDFVAYENTAYSN